MDDLPSKYRIFQSWNSKPGTNIYFKKGNSAINVGGLSLKQIKENTSCSAYHVPEGIFFRYGKNLLKIDHKYLVDGYLPTDNIQELVFKNLNTWIKY